MAHVWQVLMKLCTSSRMTCQMRTMSSTVLNGHRLEVISHIHTHKQRPLLHPYYN